MTALQDTWWGHLPDLTCCSPLAPCHFFGRGLDGIINSMDMSLSIPASYAEAIGMAPHGKGLQCAWHCSTGYTCTEQHGLHNN